MANLISALEFYAVVSAPRSIEAAFAGASIVMYSDNDAALQVPMKGGASHSLINRAIRVFRALEARGSLIVWPGRVSSSTHPQDSPSGDRPQPTKILGERAPPALQRVKDLSPASSWISSRGRGETFGNERPPGTHRISENESARTAFAKASRVAL